MAGKFIVFEGIDGAGKTTQLSLLKNYLQQQGYDVLSTREPGGTPVGEEIRNILLNPAHGDLHQRTEVLLYASARSQLVFNKIIPALEQGKIVICDRFVDSTLAYQGYGRQIPLDFLHQINGLATGGVKADMVLVFDLTVEESQSRVNKRSKSDRLEREEQDFFDRVRQGYLEICRQQPSNHRVLDASMPVQQLHHEVRGVVEEMLQCRW